MTEKQINCYECEHLKGLQDSDGNTIYLCTNTKSGAYLEETGLCGNCTMLEVEK